MLISSEKYKKMKKKKVHEQYCNVLFLDKQPRYLGFKKLSLFRSLPKSQRKKKKKKKKEEGWPLGKGHGGGRILASPSQSGVGGHPHLGIGVV
jgi:hypothetical protein